MLFSPIFTYDVETNNDVPINRQTAPAIPDTSLGNAPLRIIPNAIKPTTIKSNDKITVII
jgi:hypothetical protein